MRLPAFNDNLRRTISARLQAWPRHVGDAGHTVEPGVAGPKALKRAAVSVILTDDGQGQAALVLTLRPAI